jgi:hypothetical protein
MKHAETVLNHPRLPDNGESTEGYVAILLLKDFGDFGDVKIDSSFMTVADVPTLATMGIIENPINPFTQKPLFTPDKDSVAIITTSHKFNMASQRKNIYNIKDYEWFHVKENVFIPENWTRYSVEK